MWLQALSLLDTNPGWLSAETEVIAQIHPREYRELELKNLVEFDDVVNTQRKQIYVERAKILGGTDLKSNILDMVRDEIRNLVEEHLAVLGFVYDDLGEFAFDFAHVGLLVALRCTNPRGL